VIGGSVQYMRSERIEYSYRSRVGCHSLSASRAVVIMFVLDANPWLPLLNSFPYWMVGVSHQVQKDCYSAVVNGGLTNHTSHVSSSWPCKQRVCGAVKTEETTTIAGWIGTLSVLEVTNDFVHCISWALFLASSRSSVDIPS
jgi:hypothetical protein